ncbi:hypothetical protein ScPMuIL_012009 [Solemya velum]
MGEKTGGSFFSNLRHLAVRLDKDLSELQEKAERKSTIHYATVMKTLLDLKNNVESLKSDSNELLVQVQERSKFEDVVTLCQKVVEVQRSSHAELQDYLAQYGYTSCPKRLTAEENIGTVDGESENEESEQVKTSPKSGSGDVCKTPKLEDFGVSHYTLQMMSRSKKDRPMASDAMYVPSPFEHNGLVVTPSVLGGRTLPLYTPDRSYFEGSPCPPIFQTPGMTQIMKVPPLNFDDDTTYKSIPAPPVFTPGFREIHASNSKKTNQDNVNSKTAAPDIYGGSTTKVLRSLTFNNEAPASQQSRLVESISMEPEEPEMTVSLEVLSEMTKSFSLNGRTKKASEPPSTIHFKNNYIRNTETLPTLELPSKLDVKEKSPPASVEMKNTFMNGIGEMPKSPQFLMKYSFMNTENVPP